MLGSFWINLWLGRDRHMHYNLTFNLLVVNNNYKWFVGKQFNRKRSVGKIFKGSILNDSIFNQGTHALVYDSILSDSKLISDLNRFDRKQFTSILQAQRLKVKWFTLNRIVILYSCMTLNINDLLVVNCVKCDSISCYR